MLLGAHEGALLGGGVGGFHELGRLVVKLGGGPSLEFPDGGGAVLGAFLQPAVPLAEGDPELLGVGRAEGVLLQETAHGGDGGLHLAGVAGQGGLEVLDRLLDGVSLPRRRHGGPL
ncbi:hypothetical protein ACPCK9_28835 [Streptomyces koyangensis]|uniref:hypothetical protein n=1 Tax=Streptomyces TaxID=1883 RepID=UPI0039810D42